ncbi:phage tail protein [Rhodococcus jostii]|uniref:phage tail protein n=1 Tax=Rhodococcus jostii TaxID=132919 RepID=UPI0036372587
MDFTATVELEGVNGNWFTLSGPGMGEQGAYLGTEVDGFYDAPVKTIHNSHAFQTGSTYGGKRTLQRDLVFGIWITDDNGKSWEANDSEWRKAWSYDHEGKLWITTDTSRRFLKVRLGEHPQVQMEHDPRLIGSQKVVMTAVANDPWWYEPDAVDEWIAPTDTSGGGTVTGSVTVSNPTDVPIWLTWVIQAPGKPTLPDFSFGDDRYERAELDADREIVMPELPPGEHILVDTDEEAINGQVNSSLDTQVYLRMNGVTFCYPVPPYTPATVLPVAMSKAPAGVGIQVRAPRPWSRPWGLQ